MIGDVFLYSSNRIIAFENNANGHSPSNRHSSLTYPILAGYNPEYFFLNFEKIFKKLPMFDCHFIFRDYTKREYNFEDWHQKNFDRTSNDFCRLPIFLMNHQNYIHSKNSLFVRQLAMNLRSFPRICYEIIFFASSLWIHYLFFASTMD